MKKIIKIITFLILILVSMLLGVLYFASKPLPVGQKGIKAEALTDKIQIAINQKAWDTTNVVSFTFRGNHHYLWDKKRNLIQVKWDDKKVLYNNKTLEGVAYENDKKLTDSQKTDAINKANDYFNNDSFWLIAPFKLRDSGTTRSIVMQDNQEALMITYASGGSTPGDSYVWLVDENYMPKAWRMWVSIIPIGGLETSWEDWKTFQNNLKIATSHKGLLDLKLENVQIGQSIEEINNGVDPFTEL
ncbi:hypothetical protein [Flavobacterium degerlachei]|jgi:hypothetical protein|uniref:Outer membrane lipoprotein-sorting protein n=1 Tax=Flavobacterium degerlachei TaxID=229203 RepID=A0A1H3FVX0_9FLAO|nr:hypothetical protein [Flavobacterium degerlachei]SDX94975.1 hypothetical protein SAMN05444338_11922 [Flavobacterium degerlachei]